VRHPLCKKPQSSCHTLPQLLRALCAKSSETLKLSNELIDKGKDIAKFLEGLSVENRQKGNEAEFLRAQEEHARFKED
jgi:hypothetical protein